MTAVVRGWEGVTSLSVSEAGALLSLSRTVAYTWAAEGRLPTTRDHLGDLRVKPADVKRLLAEQANQGEQIDLFGGEP